MDDKTVLVIEDSSVVSDLVRDLLEAAGLSVVQASNSRDGLALLDEQTFDAILIDAGLPSPGGYAVMGHVRERPSYVEVPILLLTSKGRDNESLPQSIAAPYDYVQKPIDPVDLIIRVRAAVGRSVPPPSLTSVGGDGQIPNRSSSPVGGKIITVFSLKGGVGTSMIATNLAVAFRKLWDESVALVDLSLEAGALNVLLDLMASSTLDELVAHDGSITPEVIGQYLVPHKSGVYLLSAPATPERAELVSATSLRKVLSALRDAFEYVIVDTASNFADYTLLALEIADNIVVPLTGDIASIRATTTSLDIFQALSISDQKVIPVFNELFPKSGLSRKNVESTLHVTLTPLPNGGAKVMDSINLGTPLVSTEPDFPLSVAIENLAFQLSRSESKITDRPKSPDLLVKVRKRLGV